MAIFFTADTHLSHVNILRYCQRPFHSAAEMDEAIYANWAAVVQPRDTVYHLGDVAFGDEEHVARAVTRLQALPGEKYLVPGNHDHRYPELLASAFAEVLPPLYELNAQTKREGWRLVLCHYPLLTWHRIRKGALQLHGHVHGRLPQDRLRFDVGVDVWGFTPVRLERILDRVAAAKQDAELPDWA